MVSCVDDHKVVAVDEGHEAVRFGDPAGPAASEHVSQRLGLADTGGRVPQGVVHQAVDAPKRRPVMRLPTPVVVPPVVGEDKPHLASIEVVLGSLPRAGLLEALEEPPCVGRHPEQHGRLVEGIPVGS